jgi:hypothetical protein
MRKKNKEKLTYFIMLMLVFFVGYIGQKSSEFNSSIESVDIYDDKIIVDGIINATGRVYGKNLELQKEVIRDVTDFPTPIDDVIYLETSKRYVLDSLIITPYQFYLPDNGDVFLTTTSSLTDVLVYTGDKALFISDNTGTLVMDDVVVSAPFGGYFFNLYSINSTFPLVYLRTVLADDMGGMGNISNIFFISQTSILQDIGEGFIFNDCIDVEISETDFLSWKNQSTIMVNISGTTPSMNIISSKFLTDAEHSLWMDPEENIISCLINSNNYIGTNGFYADGSLDETYIYCSVKGNAGNIKSSTADGNMYFQDNADITNILVIDTPIKVNATYVEGNNERFNFSDGILTYYGIEPAEFIISANSAIRPELGVNILLATYIAENGTVIDESEMVVSSSSTRQSGVISTAKVKAVTGSYYELFAANEENTNNIIVDSTQYIISQIS